MREFIERLLNEYSSASKENFKGSSFGSYIRRQVPEEIYSAGIIDKNQYKVDASVGQGNWANVPWVAIFDKQITESAVEGVYIVYLLSSDGSSLYLTLNQGCTTIKNNSGIAEARRIMRKKADKISASISARTFTKGNTINLGEKVGQLGKLYQQGTIFYKEYKRGLVPDEETLCNDLKELVDIYAEYVRRKEEFEEEATNVSLVDEYIYSWLKLKDGRYAKCVDISLKKQFASVVPQEIYSFFGLSLALDATQSENYSLIFQDEHLNDSMVINLAHIAEERSPVYRFWLRDAKIKDAIRNATIDEDVVTFEKTGDHEYIVDVVPYESIVNTIEDTRAYPRNRIIYGAPGTGKSFKINQEMKAFLKSNSQNFERVTFHPDYAYANFVGTYKPVPDLDEDGKKIISYKFVPGPFIRIYAKAIAHPEESYLLLIEEINRAMVAAVFGDIFQLLDRNRGGESEYPITTSEDVRRYLAEIIGKDMSDIETISLPSNLYIWATMNSADQGVFPMDTAFKRRWEFEYIDINANEEEIANIMVNLPGENETIRINWNVLRHEINNKLIDCGINEDKLLGPYFLSPNSFVDSDGNIDSERFCTAFKNKVIMYLFEDAGKQHRATIFGGAFSQRAKTYSQICNKFDKAGLDIFPSDIKNPVVQYQK